MTAVGIVYQTSILCGTENVFIALSIENCIQRWYVMSSEIKNLVYLLFDQIVLNKIDHFRPFYIVRKVLVQVIIFREHLTFERFGFIC